MYFGEKRSVEVHVDCTISCVCAVYVTNPLHATQRTSKHGLVCAKLTTSTLQNMV